MPEVAEWAAVRLQVGPTGRREDAGGPAPDPDDASRDASSTRGTDLTRATFPDGSITSIAYDAASRNSVESARYGMSPAGRVP